LGDHVHQAGQLVDADRLRFDFSHFSALTKEELSQVETQINQKILSAVDVKVYETDIETARSKGAMALFGEKYGDIVRVVDVDGYSVELCGGTHVENIAKIGLFKIISESSVASGVRRIEATTGFGVLELLKDATQVIHDSSAELKLFNPNELVTKCKAVAAELKSKDREIEKLTQRLVSDKISGLFENSQSINGVHVISATFNSTTPEALRLMGDKVKEQSPKIVAVLASISDGKGTLMAVCGKEAIEMGAHAGNIVREISALAGGKGGGRPDSAMAGVAEIFRIDEALAQLPSLVQKMVRE
jgi:alanyl-tRNA synthetase